MGHFALRDARYLASLEWVVECIGGYDGVDGVWVVDGERPKEMDGGIGRCRAHRDARRARGQRVVVQKRECENGDQLESAFWSCNGA